MQASCMATSNFERVRNMTNSEAVFRNCANLDVCLLFWWTSIGESGKGFGGFWNGVV